MGGGTGAMATTHAAQTPGIRGQVPGFCQTTRCEIYHVHLMCDGNTDTCPQCTLKRRCTFLYIVQKKTMLQLEYTTIYTHGSVLGDRHFIWAGDANYERNHSSICVRCGSQTITVLKHRSFMPRGPDRNIG